MQNDGPKATVAAKGSKPAKSPSSEAATEMPRGKPLALSPESSAVREMPAKVNMVRQFLAAQFKAFSLPSLYMGLKYWIRDTKFTDL
jgi:hypothetical protein